MSFLKYSNFIAFAFALQFISLSSIGMEQPKDTRAKIIDQYNKLLPAHEVPLMLDAPEADYIVESLVAFTEEKNINIGLEKVLSLLITFEHRFLAMRELINKFPCLKNEIAIAALLGFKPQSTINCLDIDYEALKIEANKIQGVNGYFNFEKELEKRDDFWEKIKFGALVYITMTCFAYDFTISNAVYKWDIHTPAGLLFGYDKTNTSLFESGQRNGAIRCEEHYFGAENQIFWLTHVGGEEDAKKKIKGYEILLRLAHLKWDVK